MVLNIIPVAGWLLDLVFKISLAVPFYIVWTGFGIGERFFPFLPPQFLAPGFWDCVGVFIVVPIAYGIFVPRLAVVTSSSEVKK